MSISGRAAEINRALRVVMSRFVAIHHVVIHHSDACMYAYVIVEPDKAHPPFFQVFRQRIRFGGPGGTSFIVLGRLTFGLPPTKGQSRR